MWAWAFVSQFLPLNSAALVSGLDVYADECRIQKGAEWYPFLSGGGTGRGILGGGGPSGVSTPKSIHVVQKVTKKSLLVHTFFYMTLHAFFI